MQPFKIINSSGYFTDSLQVFTGSLLQTIDKTFTTDNIRFKFVASIKNKTANENNHQHPGSDLKRIISFPDRNEDGHGRRVIKIPEP